MPLTQKLLEFGLNEKEAAFYLAALELGRATLTDITEKAVINRTTGYTVVTSLKDKGLIKTLIQKRKKYYLASDPEDLQRLIDQKTSLLNHLMPQLKGISNVMQKKPKISFYEGANGIISIFMDNLTARDELLTIAGEKTFNAMILDKVPNYVKQRVDKKILLKLIAPNSETMQQWQLKDREQLRITKLVTKEKFPLKVNIDIYNNKVALTSPDEMIGLIIESKDIADSMRTVFDLVWSAIE
jgi:sugar-specific transcriptional regulator TrmB